MSSVVYNFYNCCGGEGCEPIHSVDCGNCAESQFLLRSSPIASNLVPSGLDGDYPGTLFNINPFSPSPWVGKPVFYQPLLPVHVEYRLKSLSLFKANPTGTTSEKMNMKVLAYDFAGTQLRSLSVGSIDVVAAPDNGWIDVELTSEPDDLVIKPTEQVIARFRISNVNSDNWQCAGFLSGIGVFI